MTRTQQQLAIWCGGAAVVLIIVGIVLSSRGADLETRRDRAGELHARYERLYPESGIASAEATDIAFRPPRWQPASPGARSARASCSSIISTASPASTRS